MRRISRLVLASSVITVLTGTAAHGATVAAQPQGVLEPAIVSPPLHVGLLSRGALARVDTALPATQGLSSSRLRCDACLAVASAAAAQPLSRHGRAYVGGRIGFLVGAAAGATVGLVDWVHDDGGPLGVVGYGVGGAFVGAGVGALVGALLPSRTHSVGTGSAATVTPIVRPGTRGIRMAVRF